MAGLGAAGGAAAWAAVAGTSSAVAVTVAARIVRSSMGCTSDGRGTRREPGGAGGVRSIVGTMMRV
ncbi:hypothetical protein TPA0908_18080 [Micromonospora sp. AKA38]|nr:hypothetical protein TPA0908_18080 [Micromonospora sp. AKA38]